MEKILGTPYFISERRGNMVVVNHEKTKEIVAIFDHDGHKTFQDDKLNGEGIPVGLHQTVLNAVNGI